MNENNLTAAQENFFRYSKLKDENGVPYVYYHKTVSNFEIGRAHV